MNQAAVQHQQALLDSFQSATLPSTTAGSTLSAPAVATPMPTSAPTTTQPATEGAGNDEKAQEISALLQQANAMLNKLTRLQAIQVTTDKSLQELAARMEDLGFDEGERLALLDSGASHAFRDRRAEEELPEAPASVELAGGQVVTLQQNKAGTLTPTSSSAGSTEAATILPLGALVQKLGCELSWTKRGGLRIMHPQYGVLKTVVKGNCPLLGETQALSLIHQLEQKKLQELREATAA